MPKQQRVILQLKELTTFPLNHFLSVVHCLLQKEMAGYGSSFRQTP